MSVVSPHGESVSFCLFICRQLLNMQLADFTRDWGKDINLTEAKTLYSTDIARGKFWKTTDEWMQFNYIVNYCLWRWVNWHKPFNAIKTTWCRIAGRRIVATDGIHKSIACSNTNTTTSLSHRGTQHPLVGMWVIALHWAQAGTAISTSNCIQPVQQPSSIIHHSMS